MLPNMLNVLHIIRLDYLSCILTVAATVLIGKKLWQGWVVAALNSAVVCVIGVRTAQFGFVPANLLCIALYTSNLVNWRPKKQAEEFIGARSPCFPQMSAARHQKHGGITSYLAKAPAWFGPSLLQEHTTQVERQHPSSASQKRVYLT